MPASPSSIKRAVPQARPSNLSSSVSSSQTSTRQGDKPITNTFAGSGWQNNCNGSGAQKTVDSNTEVEAPSRAVIPSNLLLSPSWQPPPLRKQINNSNWGSGVQSNNNDSGTQFVSQTPGTRWNHHDIPAAPRRSDRPGVSSGRATQTEINNMNAELGVQNNNDDDGTQYASPERQDDDGYIPVSPPAWQIQGGHWDRQINNWNEGEGSQNNNNDDGIQHVFAPGQNPSGTIITRRSDHLSSPRPSFSSSGSSKVINNYNSGRGIQNNNNDSGTQYVHGKNKQDSRVAKTVSDRASLKREPPKLLAGKESGRGTSLRDILSKPSPQPVERKRWV